MPVVRGVLLVSGVVLLAVTLLPFLRTGEWWVRVWDFPRLQIGVGLVAVLGLSLWALRHPGEGWWGYGTGTLAFLAALGLAAGYQGARMLPYTPLWPVEVRRTACAPGDRLRVMVANVLMTNREAPALLALVRERQPDVLVLLETDAWWDARLAVLDADFPHALKRPLENTYGLHVFSRLEMRGAELRRLVEEDVPSARMQLRLPGGRWIDFHALHPRPPVPGQDSEPRDAELLLVGQEMRAAPRPAVVAGDMNDVAWSSTTRLFQRISGTLDPRVGRGTFATFNANWPLLRWPLDHVFATRDFSLVALHVLPGIGSDHFPILAELCHRPENAAVQAADPATPADRERARETIRDGREEAR